MNISKFSFLLMGCFVLSLSATAQEKVVGEAIGGGFLKSGAEIAAESGTNAITEALLNHAASQSWRKAAELAAFKYYMLPNNSVREELARGDGRSEIGTRAYLNFHKWRDRAGFFNDDELKSRIAALMTRSEKNYPQFPAYYRNFPDMWSHLPANEQSLNIYEVVLDGAYGSDPVFEGRFITELNDVFALTTQQVAQPVDAHTALENVLAQAFAKKNGFLVIRVAGNEHRPKDVLLIDLSAKQFISLRQTQKSLWAKQSTLEKSGPQKTADEFVNFRGIRSSVLDRRATNGVLLGVNYVAPKAEPEMELPTRITKEGMQPAQALNESFTVMISYDTKQWAVFSMKSKEGKEIFQAFNKGYYIYFEPKDVPPLATSPWDETAEGNIYWESHDYILSFAAKKGAPLFKTVDEVQSYIAATK